jgi:hypothetical protein
VTCGDPVLEASVVEKGTTTSTITDVDGNFIHGVASGKTPVFSFVDVGLLLIPPKHHLLLLTTTLEVINFI